VLCLDINKKKFNALLTYRCSYIPSYLSSRNNVL
jgi:hypothetical protein